MPDADRFLADRDLLVSVAREAGALARSWHGRDQEIWLKAPDSPVAEADLAVNRLICSELLAARPDYAVISEENPDDRARLGAGRAFVVDPIDGTRNFLGGGRDWTVALAVVAAGRPVAAAVFAPLHDEMFDAGKGAGARRNGAPIQVSDAPDLTAVRLAGTRRLLAPLLKAGDHQRRYVPSLAYRLALVADGRLDIAVSRPGACDWDLAAADLLVHEAGGIVSDFAGGPIRYNDEDLVHPAVLGASRHLHGQVRDLLAAAETAIPR